MQKLYNGDCLEVMKELQDDSVDLVLTDIPYGEVNRKSSGLRNLDKGLADVVDFNIGGMVDELVRICKGTIYIFCGIDQISDITKRMKGHKLSTRLGQWEKTNPSPMNGTRVWLSGSEFCVVGRKPKATFNEHCKKPIWKYPVGRNKLHPTQKPQALNERLILASSNESDVVFDPFMGSGTAGAACANLGRKFIGIEKDPEYFKVAQQRIAEAGQ
jgi:DNA modification methylase